jgi:hypothetical protein
MTSGNGTLYWVQHFFDVIRKPREVYLGKVDDPEVTVRVDTLRARITATNANISRAKILARSGFATVDRKTHATLASLANYGLFRAGAVLIGSHAYSALLNSLGLRAVPYATEDIDIARRTALGLVGIPPFIDMLRQTGIDFFAVPQLERGAPPSSFAERGGSRLRVDLLVPSPDSSYPLVPVPELQAYATGLPYLAYLLGDSQEVAALSPHAVINVRIPAPERFATHKLIVSQLRDAVSSKADKDLRQAATLIDAVSALFPGAIEEALGATPLGARRHVAGGVRGLRAHLPDSADEAWESLSSVTGADQRLLDRAHESLRNATGAGCEAGRAGSRQPGRARSRRHRERKRS